MRKPYLMNRRQHCKVGTAHTLFATEYKNSHVWGKCWGLDDERANASGRFKLDFSGLKQQHKAVRSAAEREALHAEFRREIDARVATLAHVAPNLKALEQFQAIKVCHPTCLLAAQQELADAVPSSLHAGGHRGSWHTRQQGHHWFRLVGMKSLTLSFLFFSISSGASASVRQAADTFLPMVASPKPLYLD